MRKRARVDANQSAIVKALRQMGCSVLVLSQLGDGAPDVLAGRAGRNYLLEIKDGSRVPSERRLTKDEQTFHDSWAGHRAVVESVDEAIQEVMR